MSKSIIASAAGVAAIVGVALALNPSPERHREEIKQAFAERSPIAGMLGLGVLSAFASTYHTVGVASYTTAGETTLSIGVLGMVFVVQ